MHSKTLVYHPPDREIAELAARHGRRRESLLEIFRALQGRRGGLTREAIAEVARALGVPAGEAYGVATFYSMLSVPPRTRRILRVCDGPACRLRGAEEIRRAAESDMGAEWTVTRTSCLGLCDRAPAALVDLEGEDSPASEQYGPLTRECLAQRGAGWRGEERSYAAALPGEVRALLASAGKVDPSSLESALAQGAYQGLEKALKRRPEEIIEEMEASGLRGRGGAGFPTGRKWRFVAQETRLPKYVVCNADESEPLVFKDRVLMETNPHAILEGMALAAYAVGAEQGLLYIRGEYQPQARLLGEAVRQAEERGLLGARIQGSDFSFQVRVHRGAGAYICGEETGLLESLEGWRGEPRIRPPYPTVKGYRSLPTVVNNVETLATAALVASRGADWYRSLGNSEVPGTKIYTLLGHVRRPGLFEAPFRLTLRKIVEEFGGGMRPGSRFKFALTGGAAGTFVPADLLDVPIDYRAGEQGISLGAGAFLICDETVSPAALLRDLVHFFEAESCGKCTPCRVGTRRAREILDQMAAGEAAAAGREELGGLADLLHAASFCGLGQAAAMPIRTALTHFPEAFEGSSSPRDDR